VTPASETARLPAGQGAPHNTNLQKGNTGLSVVKTARRGALAIVRRR
jgi:hypothetical protein